MFKKYRTLAVASLLGIGMFAVSAGGASATIIPVVQQGAAGEMTGANDLLQNVNHRRGHNIRQWNRSNHGPRCRSRLGNCRHYYRGYYYSSPWWLIAAPLVIGGAIVVGDGYGSGHVRWCSERYRSYNRRNNTWVSYSGEVRQCNSPY
jgi:hypothetical protein